MKKEKYLRSAIKTVVFSTEDVIRASKVQWEDDILAGTGAQRTSPRPDALRQNN